MSKQLHKNFVDEQVKLLLKSYMDKEIKINYILQILGIKRSRFFELLNRYKKDPDNFSIQYNRKTINRKIDKAIEINIIKELNREKDLIKAKGVNNLNLLSDIKILDPKFLILLPALSALLLILTFTITIVVRVSSSARSR